MATLLDLLAEYGCASFDRQEQLARRLEDCGGWKADLTQGILNFEHGPQFAVQVLGSDDHEDGTWLWAWANHSDSLPDDLVRDAKRVHAFGQERKVEEMTRSLVPLTALGGSGHTLALIAAGICGSDAYYCGPKEGGVVYFLLTGDGSLHRAADDGGNHFLATLMSFIEMYPVNHRMTLRSYAKYKQYGYDEQRSQAICLSPHGERLCFVFDEAGRIAGAEGALTAAPDVVERRSQ